MESNFVIGIDPELARALIFVGLVATVGALFIAVAMMVMTIHIALSVYRGDAVAGCAGDRKRANVELARSHLVV